MNSGVERPSGEKMAAPRTKLLEALTMVMPEALTALGRRPSAVFTRFWMATAARSGSRSRSKVAVIVLTPLLLLVEVTYFMPSAPLICCSRGTVTAVSTVWALAPTYTLVTETCGGARVGNCAIGKVGITAEPARIISSAQTVAKTGRFMKKSTNIQERTSDFRPLQTLL